MKILSALNAFKDAPTGVVGLNKIVSSALSGDGDDVKVFPIADGGTGTIEAFDFHCKAQGGETKTTKVRDPLGRDVEAKWIHLPQQDTAIISMAEASGTQLLKTEEKDPLKTTTEGTGELVQAALAAGARRILLTVGGSATVDGGMGMLKKLGAKFLDEAGNEVEPNGSGLKKVKSIELDAVKTVLRGVELVFLSDVQTPFMVSSSSDGQSVMSYAAQKFPNQKNPPTKAMEELQQGVYNFAKVVDAMASGTIASHIKATGAAGGLPYIPVALLGAKANSGFNHLAEMFKLKQEVYNADIVITGEGRLDRTTFEGKGPAELIELAKQANKPVVFVCGSADSGFDYSERGINMVIELQNAGEEPKESISQTAARLEEKLRASKANMLQLRSVSL